MMNQLTTPYIGQTPLATNNHTVVRGDFVEINGESFYRIDHYDHMPPFFMSLVSGGDHWFFIASTGGLSAGRTNANSALFPYETDDKLTMNHDTAGSKTVFLVTRNGHRYLWEPFSARYDGAYDCQRRLYKNVVGNKLIFEEINRDLALTYRLQWCTGERLGVIKQSWLLNKGTACHIDILDGLLNVLPYGATAQLQNGMSNLLNAYKRNELETETGLGIFSMSATLTDQAEPSESLKATVVWQVGLENPTHLLCSQQIEAFRQGQPIEPETDVLGQAGAYLVNSQIELEEAGTRQWHIVADVNQDGADVVGLTRLLEQDETNITAVIETDMAANTAVLVDYMAAADGLQLTANQSNIVHHFANVMFNVMRGGIFAAGYIVEKRDLLAFCRVRNQPVVQNQQAWFNALPVHLPIQLLYAQAHELGDPNVVRLCYEYLPLTFSRRHGDPSRPWNQFSINLKNPDGTRRLDYQGNWRDIFQNWEPLAASFPAYTTGIIAKFLNATTADGYNPYRVTRAGIEWEVPEPENPWANIGYWSDHQIIYLQKLLELAEQTQPGSVATLWNEPLFTYADVPYRLRSYDEMLVDWYNTIDFDWEEEKAVEKRVAAIGTDGKLVHGRGGAILHVTMTEKLLVLLLAKLTNLVPEGGIWMNTQRPEWNDANNALVGKGLSVVTTAYVRRFIAFWQAQLATHPNRTFTINTAVADLLQAVQETFAHYTDQLATGFDGRGRRAVMDRLGQAATTYRTIVYDHVPETTTDLSATSLADFLAVAQSFVEQTLRVNRRPDGLYHSYNILQVEDGQATVEHLYLMLEGQVAILSAGLLDADEALTLLKALRASALYRADQHSYMLYPNRTLPKFQEKNNIPAECVADSALVQTLLEKGDVRLIQRDVAGNCHFNGTFRNANDVRRVLDDMTHDADLADMVTAERAFVLDLFEETFNHRAFTGRSGTFFAYEGLGSIYWHMVSKLLLAVQECYWQAVDSGAGEAVCRSLAEHYYDIRAGIGYKKTPAVYGAFPTDPYSHTPWGQGAKQPGMTGQVKEEILTRWGELGVRLQAGSICFAPLLLEKEELLDQGEQFAYVDVAGRQQTVPVPAGGLAFTICQVPVLYQVSDTPGIVVHTAVGTTTQPHYQLDPETTAHLFARDGHITRITVHLNGE